jgi:DNA/RNA endonuclease YhcR with UshA esterase domain
MLTLRLSLLAAVCALSLPLVFAQEAPAQLGAAKSQASAASKTAKFGTVKAGDGSVAKALKASDLAGAKKLVGKEGTFEGVVVKVFSPSSNSLVILNFDKNYRNALTAVLRTKNYAAFPDMQTLKGKRVLISGTFEDYKGSTEIQLTKPEQVKLVQE